jgi:hypothetical protein
MVVYPRPKMVSSIMVRESHNGAMLRIMPLAIRAGFQILKDRLQLDCACRDHAFS